jgi:hypothetical protein
MVATAFLLPANSLKTLAKGGAGSREVGVPAMSPQIAARRPRMSEAQQTVAPIDCA